MAPLIFPFNFSLQQLDSIHVRDISSEDMDFFGQVSLQIPVLQFFFGFEFLQSEYITNGATLTGPLKWFIKFNKLLIQFMKKMKTFFLLIENLV